METPIGIQYSYLIPLLPLLGAVVAGFLGARWLKGQSHWPIWLGVGASAVLSFSILVGMGKHLHHGSIVKAPSAQGEAGAGEAGSSANLPYPYVNLVAPQRVATEAGQHGQDEGGTWRLAASQDWYTWVDAGWFKATAGFFFDTLSTTMLCVVTGIGFFITVFAAGYMKGEAGYFRFFAYLGLFIFSMTILVMGNNFIMLYLGWEGVGLCSYLLIGYYYDKPAAREAAKKAFLVNRIGDFGFGLGIMLAYTAFGTVSYFGSYDNPGVLTQATAGNLTAYQQMAMDWLPFLLMVGAFGKSAQFPLYVWLPDAMEGPTPVSALIHAATMVTAGVYMIARCSTLFVANEAAMVTVAVVGAFTALFAGTIALRQFDLKKVFAYSTVSQLGFMFVGVAVLAPVAGMFHLITHAFFKALLFLSSGVVMHAMMGELDMRKMSGLKRVLPKTRWLMLIGCLALAGVIPFSGFWSKDEIVIAAFSASKVLGSVMLLTALLTAYYTFRLYFRVFEGPEVIPAAPAGGHGHGHGHDEPGHHEDAEEAHAHAVAEEDAAHGHGHHNHEPWIMMLPLFVLALGAIFAGALNMPGTSKASHMLGHFLGQSPSFAMGYHKAFDHYRQHGRPGSDIDPAMWGTVNEAYQPVSHTTIMVVSILVAFLGILLAYVYHLKDRQKAEALAARMPRLTRLLEGKYWVDEIYQAGIVEPLRKLGGVFFAIDRFVVDGIVWIVGFVPQLFGFTLKLTTQRGSLQGYAVAMLLCAAAILVVVFLR